MRSSSLARVVMASFGVSVVITLGCGKPPSAPSPLPSSPQPSFSVRSISPSAGPTVGVTVATIAVSAIPGTEFQPGATVTVTVDGSRVDATVLSANTISLAMPAHAAGNVNVTVINPLSQAQANVPGGYTYVGPPVISELLPNIGSTDGGTPIVIIGAGTGAMGSVVTVTVDGIVSTFESDWPNYDAIYLSTPAHAAGTVEVIVTDRYGQAGSGVFTYASPATFDFNGDWKGWARLESPPVPVGDLGARLVLTIRNNIAVNVSCWECRPGDTVETCAIVRAPSLTLDPPPVVANGEFSFAGSGGASITGKILSPNYASGSITMASCGTRQWSAERK